MTEVTSVLGSTIKHRKDVFKVNKEVFCQYIKELKRYYNYIDDKNKLYNKYKLGSISMDFVCYDLAISILEEVFKDKEYQWIRYFIHELNYGEDYYDSCIIINGKNITLKTPEELYDLLLDNYTDYL